MDIGMAAGLLVVIICAAILGSVFTRLVMSMEIDQLKDDLRAACKASPRPPESRGQQAKERAMGGDAT